MTTFWEDAFRNNKEMWGFEPAVATVLVKEFFVSQKIKNILIPGIGYGRNAQLFRDNGIAVTGIEISKTAIALAHQHYGDDLKIHQGSVTQMPFDNQKFDGIYGYAILHLLDKKERAKFIEDCYSQLQPNGFMIFTTPTKEASLYGQGRCVDKDRYEVFGGVEMFFYDEVSIREEFVKAGHIEVSEVMDVYPFYVIKCHKTV